MVLRCREQRARLVRIRNVVSLGLIAVLASGCLVGVGDPYFPTYGNGGYDVAHYDLAIRYDPGTDVLQGTASIDARATSALPIFDLDLMGLTVHGITVDGRPARWAHGAHELTVTPARPVRAHQKFRVVVVYSGVPVPTVNGGFIATYNGAAVSGQPEGAATWFPVNDHPIDKATYTFRVTVPDGLGVIANGLPAGAPSRGHAGVDDARLADLHPDGELPRDRRHRELGRPAASHDVGAPRHRRGRSQVGRAAGGRVARAGAGDDRLPEQSVRPLPGRERGGDRRRPPTALRARDPDPSDLPGLLLPGSPTGTSSSSTSSPTSGTATASRSLAGRTSG